MNSTSNTLTHTVLSYTRTVLIHVILFGPWPARRATWSSALLTFPLSPFDFSVPRKQTVAGDVAGSDAAPASSSSPTLRSSLYPIAKPHSCLYLNSSQLQHMAVRRLWPRPAAPPRRRTEGRIGKLHGLKAPHICSGRTVGCPESPRFWSPGLNPSPYRSRPDPPQVYVCS